MWNKSEVFAKLQEKTFRFRSEKELYKLFHAEKAAARDELSAILDELLADGSIVLDKNKKFVTAKEIGAMTGTVQGSDRGFAFFIPDDKTLPDLFLPPRALNYAMHKDRVLAKKADKTSATSDEGEVLAVLSRGMQRLSGKFDGYGDFSYVTPDEKRFPGDVFIERGRTHGAKPGDKVLVKITRFPSRGGGATGVVEEILTADSQLKTEELAIIRSYGLTEDFPIKVRRQAEKVAALPVETAGRDDLTGLLTVTIDGEDTRDYDDAVSLLETETGETLYVHIADVSHYVTAGDVLDEEALARGTSVYFPDRAIPMLPKALSCGACSLNPGEPRYTLSVAVKFDKNGTPLSSSLTESVIVSNARLTYEGVNRLLAGGEAETAGGLSEDATVTPNGLSESAPVTPNGQSPESAAVTPNGLSESAPVTPNGQSPENEAVTPEIKQMLQKMARLAGILAERRERRGAIDLSVREAKIVCRGDDVTVEEAERGVSHRMIEEFMILANEAVAAFADRAQIPFVYRVHETPAPEKMGAFAEFLKGLGVSANLGGAVTPKDLQRILEEESASPHAALLNLVLLRSMQKARYDTRNLGHFGLSSEHYCHFTSPIRRYPDLIVHRTLKRALAGEKFTEQDKKTADVAAKESSARELAATEAERAVDDLYKTYFMGQFLGETVDAVVSGVTSFGIFAETDAVTEGLIRIARLPNDRYELDEAAYTLRGKNHAFSLGESVKVRVISANLAERRVEFDLVTDEEQGGVIAAGKSGKGKKTDGVLSGSGKRSGKAGHKTDGVPGGKTGNPSGGKTDRKTGGKDDRKAGGKAARNASNKTAKKSGGKKGEKRGGKVAFGAGGRFYGLKNAAKNPRSVKGKAQGHTKGRAGAKEKQKRERVSPRGGAKRYTNKRQG